MTTPTTPASTAERPPPGTVATAMADARYDRFRNPSWRRRLSLAQLAATAALMGAGAMVFLLGAGPVAAVAALVVAFVPWMLVTGALNASVHGLTEIRDADLDELQRRIRDAVYRRAYRIVSAVVLAVVVLVPFAGVDGIKTGPALAVGAVVLCVVLGLPVHLLAWTLPDDDN